MIRKKEKSLCHRTGENGLPGISHVSFYYNSDVVQVSFKVVVRFLRAPVKDKQMLNPLQWLSGRNVPPEIRIFKIWSKMGYFKTFSLIFSFCNKVFIGYNFFSGTNLLLINFTRQTKIFEIIFLKIQ